MSANGKLPIKSSKIPKGLYCYRVTRRGRIMCPYWRALEDLPYQENGYCEYLGKSDWDINEGAGNIAVHFRDSVAYVSAHELKNSLLWDKCKECGID